MNAVELIPGAALIAIGVFILKLAFTATIF